MVIVGTWWFLSHHSWSQAQLMNLCDCVLFIEQGVSVTISRKFSLNTEISWSICECKEDLQCIGSIVLPKTSHFMSFLPWQSSLMVTRINKWRGQLIVSPSKTLYTLNQIITFPVKTSLYYFFSNFLLWAELEVFDPSQSYLKDGVPQKTLLSRQGWGG